MIPKNRAATPAANAHVGMRPAFGARAETICGKDICNAPSAGHTATHSKHPVHSADLMVISLSTGRLDGQTLAHFAQSMQASGERRMRSGLSREARPNSAP